MSKNSYHNVLPLILGVSLLILVKGQVPTKFNPINYASEQGITPLDEEIPVNSEGHDGGSTGDNEFEGDDLVIFEKDILVPQLLVQKKNITRTVQSFNEHSIEITTPPPRS